MTNQPRRVPLRTCVVCRQTSDKRQLLRVIRTAGEVREIKFDRSGKANGRGAYVCASQECIEKAIKQKRFERSLNVAAAPETLGTELREAAQHAVSAGVNAL